MKYKFIILVLYSFHTLTGQNESKKILNSFFLELMNGNKNNDVLFENYFYQNPPLPDEGRSLEDILYYKDTLIQNIRGLFKNQRVMVAVYTLQEAKKEEKSFIVYDYYYELQKDYIYVIKLKSDNFVKFFYALMIDFNEMNKDLKFKIYKKNKIVSLEPQLVKLNRIIQWR